jgi:peptidoglycan/LPS O-acetylase OafA/YrhL
VGRLGYRPALDGVRALAIAPVVSYHAFGWADGWMGVDLFFVLSGFLITTLLLEEQAASGTISFRAFYRRRAARLFPGLLLMLAVLVIITRGAHAWSVLFAATYTTNIAAVLGHRPPPALAQMWSLAQEEQFYLWWPPVLLLVMRFRPALLIRVLCLLIAAVVVEKAALVATGATAVRVYQAPDTHAVPLLVGCLIGALFVTGRIRVLSERAALAALAAVVAVIVASIFVVIDSSSLQATLYPFACGLLVVAAVGDRGVARRLLAARPCVFVGRISYSIYLWHLPVLAAAGARAADAHRLRAALMVCAAVVVAAASFRFVEQPLRTRLRTRRARASGAAVLQPS